MSFDVEDLLPEVVLEDGEGSEVTSETWVTSIDDGIVLWRETSEPVRNARGMKEEFREERVSERERGNVEVSRGVQLISAPGGHWNHRGESEKFHRHDRWS